MFDESHGRWATTQARFTPQDFGRSAGYTYSLLARYAAQLTSDSSTLQSEVEPLPSQDTLFVLKMPSTPLSADFGNRLRDWVATGGRLLIVTDHTDLYDHAQHINRILPQFGTLRLGPNAVYDAAGFPNRPIAPSWTRAIGRVDGHGQGFPWLTGTNASSIPIGAVVLASYGPGFSEPGDYGRPNRFGPLVPRTTLPYGDFASAVGFGHGRGAIAIVMDSTMWSNFAVFREEYRRLFRGILGALTEPLALRTLGWLLFMLIPLCFIVAQSNRLPTRILLAIVLGGTIGLGWRVSSAGTGALVEGRDHGIRVVVGSGAKLEFLPQLVGPGERNYSRIISSLAKYQLDPIASAPGVTPGPLVTASRWLFIEPSPAQLPTAHRVIAHLRAGGNIGVLFAPEAAADPRIRAWLLALDVGLGPSSALALAEDAWRVANGAFSARRGAAVLRDVRTITLSRSDGIMKEYAFDRLWQTYTVRPTTLPRTSGLLVLGFGADQLADAAIGDVWEGVRPSSIGGLRELQLARLLRGEDAPGPWPGNLLVQPRASHFETLRRFLVTEDGRVLLEGEITDDRPPEGHATQLSFVEDPLNYLADLRLRAISHLITDCLASQATGTTICSDRLLTLDGTEWLVTRSDTAGVVTGIELLHERRWSGLGANINVVFAD